MWFQGPSELFLPSLSTSDNETENVDKFEIYLILLYTLFYEDFTKVHWHKPVTLEHRKKQLYP